MGKKEMKPLRAVLDTNCLVSALIFKGVLSSKFRSMWQNNQVVPIVCPETQNELKDVLKYPKFSLSVEMQHVLLCDFLSHAECLLSIQPIEAMPELADPNDAMFIRLDQKAKTDFLVSGDKHILSLCDRFPELHIVSPTEFMALINI